VSSLTRAALRAVTLVLLWSIAGQAAPQEAYLTVVSTPPRLATSLDATHPGLRLPGRDSALIAGHLESPSFSITSLDHVTIISPDSSVLPLIIDTLRAFRELGSIVSMDFCVACPAALLSDPTAVFTVRWGLEVKAANKAVAGLRIAPEGMKQARSFQYYTPIQPLGNARKVSLKVMARRNAFVDSLWYALPMLLCFVLLTIRRFLDDRTPAMRHDRSVTNP
jgi:hypothetical protein